MLFLILRKIGYLKNLETNLSTYAPILEMGLVEEDELQFKTSKVIEKQPNIFCGILIIRISAKLFLKNYR